MCFNNFNQLNLIFCVFMQNQEEPDDNDVDNGIDLESLRLRTTHTVSSPKHLLI